MTTLYDLILINKGIYMVKSKLGDVNMKQRWYDKDATVSLAVSLLQNASESSKKLCANEIISIAKAHGVIINNGILTKINNTFKRWYDEDTTLTQAMEYLKNSSHELKKDIALEVIHTLEQNP